MWARFFTLATFLFLCVIANHGQSSEFTYQGRLVDGSLTASGIYEMRFRMFDAASGGTQQPQPTPITLDLTVANNNAVTVTNGVFTVKLDFTAAAFPGEARFLEISVRRTAGDAFTPLTPRQPVTSTPHSVKSLSSGLSDGLSVACVLCVTNTQIQSIDGDKVTGAVADATTAVNVSGVVPIANGGTGSSIQTFVDLTTNQSILGNKRFVQTITLDSVSVGTLTTNGTANFNSGVNFNGANPVQMNALNVGNGLSADVASVSELNATGGLSGNVVDAQSHFTIAGSPVLRATDEHLLVGLDTAAAGGLTRATAIGHGTTVGANDSIVLGTTPGFFLPVPNTRVGIGVISPTTKLDVGGQVLIRSNIANPPTGGGLRGLLNVVQTGAGDANFYLQGANGGRGINFAANVVSGSPDASLVISQYDGTTYQPRFMVSGLGDVGIGTLTPAAKLDVAGTLRVRTIGISGVNAVCLDASLIISACSSSSRYKNNIVSFGSGLDLIARLRPVTFNWKADNKLDMGLVAEEVAELEPLLATYNSKGEVEGVKYDRIGVVLVNAVKEQQEQIELQKKLLDQQQRQIDALQKLLCAANPLTEICREKER